MQIVTKRLTILYCGAGYFGWQVQAPQSQKTIQGTLIDVLQKISPSSSVKIMGSGRTDTGVHALKQIAKLEWSSDLDNQSLLKALNCLLPSEIRIIDIDDCSPEFHPVRDAIKKEYRYYFTTGSAPHPFLRHMVATNRFSVNSARIAEALNLFIGEHDFKNFSCRGTDVKSTVRKIFVAEYHHMQSIELCGMALQDIHCIRFEGSGFLKQMVRQLVGAAWNYSRGQTTKEEIVEALQGKREFRCGISAPGEGLYLHDVTYKN